MATSVTKVLDYFAEPYLVAWKLRTKDWESVSKRATELGSMIDEAVRVDIKEDKPAFVSNDPEANNCWAAWTKFKQDRPDVLERMRRFHENMQRELVIGELVGHPDFILDDEVIDLKTSKRVSKSHWMQTAQYAHMENISSNNFIIGKFDEIVGLKIKKISILRLDKESGEYELKTLENPFISFWQRKFQARYEAFKEDVEFAEMMRVKLEEEKL